MNIIPRDIQRKARIHTPSWGGPDWYEAYLKDPHAYVDRNKVEGRSLAESRRLVNERIKQRELFGNNHIWNIDTHYKCLSGAKRQPK